MCHVAYCNWYVTLTSLPMSCLRKTIKGYKPDTMHCFSQLNGYLASDHNFPYMFHVNISRYNIFINISVSSWISATDSIFQEKKGCRKIGVNHLLFALFLIKVPTPRPKLWVASKHLFARCKQSSSSAIFTLNSFK